MKPKQLKLTKFLRKLGVASVCHGVPVGVVLFKFGRKRCFQVKQSVVKDRNQSLVLLVKKSNVLV